MRRFDHRCSNDMKYLLIGIGAVALAFLVVQMYISNDLAKTEQQPYEVIWNRNGVEARFYPEAVLATVKGSSPEYRVSANQHFRVLAGYIFGGNERNQSIAMTSPVHMSFDESGSEMSFVMPKDMAEEELPKPKDRGIKFSRSSEKYVVALRFGGWANDKRITKYADELLKKLIEMGIRPISEPWYMGYNPPFQVINRRNEIAVEVSASDLGQ